MSVIEEMRILRFVFAAFAVLFLLPLATHAAFWRLHGWAGNWSTADWSSSGLLSDAASRPDAEVLFLAARVGRWRGIFAEHCWLVMKDKGGEWRRYEVVGWGSPVRFNGQPPDGRWYGNDPRIFASFSGTEAEGLIPQIEAAITSYPWQRAGSYRAWPGPNSNSFIRHIAQSVPDLKLVLPNTAVGRGYRADGRFFGRTASGTGYELSLGGLFGISLGWEEGLEIDVLAAVSGIDIRHPGLKLPGWGRIGF